MKRRISSETAAILAFFLTSPGVPRYGLEILRATAVSSGTLYPILIRLEKDGTLACSEPGGGRQQPGSVRGRARRYYRLTKTGRARAAADLEAWQLRQRKRGELFAGSSPESETA